MVAQKHQPGCPCCDEPPCLIVEDNFLGSPRPSNDWTKVSGTWTEGANSYARANADGDLLVYPDSAMPGLSVIGWYLEYRTISSSCTSTLRHIINYQDTDNYWFAELSLTYDQPTGFGGYYPQSSGDARLYQRSGGVNTLKDGPTTFTLKNSAYAGDYPQFWTVGLADSTFGRVQAVFQSLASGLRTPTVFLSAAGTPSSGYAGGGVGTICTTYQHLDAMSITRCPCSKCSGNRTSLAFDVDIAGVAGGGTAANGIWRVLSDYNPSVTESCTFIYRTSTELVTLNFSESSGTYRIRATWYDPINFRQISFTNTYGSPIGCTALSGESLAVDTNPFFTYGVDASSATCDVTTIN